MGLPAGEQAVKRTAIKERKIRFFIINPSYCN
jgi:hypothetical protein